MDKQTMQASFKCPKCSNTLCEMGEVRTAGGFWTKFFNIQNQFFRSLTCTQCQYTELYKGKTSTVSNVLDFLLGLNEHHRDPNLTQFYRNSGNLTFYAIPGKLQI